MWYSIIQRIFVEQKQNTMTENIIATYEKLVKREFYPAEIVDYFKAHGFLFWSWGASNFVNFKNVGLSFKVRGHHHKGYVFVALDWSDTFDVHIVSNKGEVLNTYTNVYINELFDTIDNRIEKIADYVR